jgi:hypothetical protein
MLQPKSIIIRLQGGLGNQLYEYATARDLSIKTGKKLLIDSRPIAAEGPHRQYELSVFNIKEHHVSGLTKWITRWVASARLGKLFKICFPLAWGYKLIRDKEIGFESRILDDNWGSIVLQGYWQSFKYFEDIEDIIRKDFTFKLPPDSINMNFINELEINNSVAIHVRRGDYVEVPFFSKNLGTCTMEYYNAAIQLIMKSISNPHFYIFTDDPDWAEKNLKLPAPAKAIRHNLGKSDFEDLRLLTHCKHFIIANSSFSWWGAWLSVNPNKMVIAPKKWFNIDKTVTEDRIPSNWIKL